MSIIFALVFAVVGWIGFPVAVAYAVGIHTVWGILAGIGMFLLPVVVAIWGKKPGFGGCIFYFSAFVHFAVSFGAMTSLFIAAGWAPSSAVISALFLIAIWLGSIALIAFIFNPPV